MRFVSGCQGNSGRYGCEIWLARRLPFGSVGAECIWLDGRKVMVLHSDPHLLALRVQLRGSSLFVISGHAPHEADDVNAKDMVASFQCCPRIQGWVESSFWVT